MVTIIGNTHKKRKKDVEITAKWLDEDTIEGLLKLKWWDWDDAKIFESLKYWHDPKEFLKRYSE